MYKILIVDDEAVVREGIKNLIHWSEFGFELIGGCKNGKEAIEVIQKSVPDVVITDICMPIMDGMALTKYIADFYPSVKVMLLTGFDEFEYAQQAIKLKVVDFIVKPITAAEFKSILGKVKLDLDREIDNVNSLNKLKRQLDENFEILKLRFVNQWVSNHLTAIEIYEKLTYFNINLKQPCWSLLIIDVDDTRNMKKEHPHTDLELLYLALFNFCEETLNKWTQGIVFQNDVKEIIILINEVSRETMHQKAMDIAQEIKELAEEYLKFTVSIGMSTPCENIEAIPAIYEEAHAALDYRFLLGNNQVIYIRDVEDLQHKSNVYAVGWMDYLVSDIKTGSIKHIDEILEDSFKRLEESFVSIEQCYLYIQQVLFFILHALGDIKSILTEIEEEEQVILKAVYQFKTMIELKGWLKELCKRISLNITSKKLDQFTIHALKAEDYIRENYQRNLTLTSVCQDLCLSRSYFSMIMKQHTGMTFIEYLTNLRIEKAKELLKSTHLKTYEIADEVGYEDAHYFSLIFKKGTGTSPTEYRKSYD